MAKDDKAKDSRPKGLLPPRQAATAIGLMPPRQAATAMARLPKGMRDVGPAEVRGMERMLAKIRGVYELYGFEPLATSALEFSDALGKFLPDQERPNAGVFSFQDEDGDWLSLRYDLTAPLARYVAENFDRLPKPYRRYQVGSVWRNEKPGPGRFREFVQFDADTVGTDNVAADAEICMMAADALEAIGVEKGLFVINVNNRLLLDGLRDDLGLGGGEYDTKWLRVMRAIDKYDRLGRDAVYELLTTGRKDASGDFTEGAGLTAEQSERIRNALYDSEGLFLTKISDDVLRANNDMQLTHGGFFVDNKKKLAFWRKELASSDLGIAGVEALERMFTYFEAARFGSNRIRFNQTVVRGLEYYTGPVFEAELTFQIAGDDGLPVRFGSVGGGGRYDGLVSRFTGQPVPATGFSIGVSRLYAALQALGKTGAETARGPVLVLVMDKTDLGSFQALAAKLRAAGIPAEMYVGSSGMKAQMKYADKRGSPCVVIQGGDEKAKGEVTIKDLIAGAEAAATITDRAQWTEGRPAQVSVPEADMVRTVQEILARHSR